jgi:peptide/nickel transport system permease protein
LIAYVLRRLLLVVPTLIGVSVVTFALVKIAPGDPSLMVESGEVQDAGVDLEAAGRRVREQLLLDEPVWKQYLHYVGPFDLGRDGHRWFGGSGADPWGRLRVTVPLASLAILLSYLLAVPLGVYSAVRRGSAFDVATSVVLFLLYAVPTFWAAIVLQGVFGATGLGWLPVIGLHDKDAADLSGPAYAWDFAKHLILPVVCYGYGSLAYLSRQMRVGVLDNIRADYVRTARAKGLSERAVILKHVLRNSLIPILTLFASVLPILIGGSVIVELVFDIPGMGRYAYEGLMQRDVNVIMATTLFSALMTILGILLTDVLYAVVDPRIRYDAA